jgi:hypothetical protein
MKYFIHAEVVIRSETGQRMRSIQSEYVPISTEEMKAAQSDEAKSRIANKIKVNLENVRDQVATELRRDP